MTTALQAVYHAAALTHSGAPPDFPAMLNNFLTVAMGSAIGLGVRYALFAGAAWLFGYVLFKRRWFHRKIVQKFPAHSEMRRELLWSLSSIAIFALVGAVTVALWKHGWTQMYGKIGRHGPVWFWVSIGLAILLHDTYFYWTHRAMHHPKLFKLFHRTHHLSHNPSPWAAYAFSPAEAVVQAGIFPVVAFAIPIHPYAFALFMLWQILFNVVGHTGYEYNPSRLMRSWIRFLVNTPTNHAMHHEKLVGNYGLYFSFWDYLMRTQHREYEQRFIEVTERPREPAAIARPASVTTEALG